jgi:hypothetical protein
MSDIDHRVVSRKFGEWSGQKISSGPPSIVSELSTAALAFAAADAGPSKTLLKILAANLQRATEPLLRARLAAAIKRLHGAR